MSMELALCLLTLFGLAAIGTPIGYSIILGSLVYLGAAGLDVALAGEKILQGLYNSFVLLAVPLFIAAANIMNAGTISERLLNFCVAAVGRFKGGLGHVNVVASLIFSGMSGSAVADAAGIGKIIIGMMTKDGRYSRGYAAAITAASATIGPIIPPSIPMVLYALVSNASIGALFLAGILPGLVMGGVLMAMNYYLAKKRGFAIEEPVPLRELPRYTANAFPALLMPVILLVGIYGGVTTPTEAAAVAAFYALLLAGLFYRALSWHGLYRIFVESARSSAAVGIVIGGALILNFVVISENIPAMMSQFLQGVDVHPLVFLIGVNILVLLLGCILDATTIILVIVPLFIPTCRDLGIDLVHFGVLVVVNSMIGLITPPYGILLFVINAVTGIPLREIISEVWAFLGVLIGALVLMILFPEIVLFLPRLLGYGG
ncbi:MAG: TRAP transporter large permease [Roseibium album]|uniref:TRAP transporter large permease n=1 Tax=Roseibium album TaxID=311410 RepID=UPI000CF126A9|nr:TRAP transporter large permease [Roseibium album]MBG6144921.1 tripartite ATP-independent transporter DctM subunit [Labrenzia sp. EL_142]MBG6156865.1 tripartite ATP-independent transporter DctM subunit [Labrenzia sp. EL_162]MBG6163523.1 tripartite ATP-independent transporter DctM subunit [Labrenzia sp. EL_195]MBG6173057.1 tripartite ATP-independent transporter DctM subunit [Labrenzia sp. EL_132]MBG6195195.1 tripartite ATP-independent transporter DctM subunit [Labrenzia sp. EL_159]MBG6203224